MKSLLFIAGALFIGTTGFSQVSSKNKIVGIVYQKSSDPKIPIKNASVSIPGVGNATSDNNGSFAIGLSQCQNCITGKTLKIYVNSEYGYGDLEYVIPIDPNLNPCEIAISPNRKMSIHGLVMGDQPGSFLEGVKVRAIIQNYEQPIPPVLTDQNGYFNLIIRKEGVSTLQAIQLLFSDERSNYQSMEKVVFLNQLEPVKVMLAVCRGCGSKDTLKVYRDVTSPIHVEQGDLITISAAGIIKVGDIIGTSGPEGFPNNRGWANTSLAMFNYFANWNHGALMYRVGEMDDWKCYVANNENTFQASRTALIQFKVNDADQTNNSGYYTVIVTIKK